MSDVLTTVPGCGRCADLLAAYLLTGDDRFHDRLSEHLDDHEPARSVWPEVNELAEVPA